MFAVWRVPADTRGWGAVSPGGGERVEVTAEGQCEGAPLFLRLSSFCIPVCHQSLAGGTDGTMVKVKLPRWWARSVCRIVIVPTDSYCHDLTCMALGQTDVSWRHTTEVYWRFTESLLEVYWKFTESLLEVYWKFTEGLLKVYWKFTGGLLEDIL